jgi:hypothetical protein
VVSIKVTFYKKGERFTDYATNYNVKKMSECTDKVDTVCR